jgi:hypothetical protein
VWQPAPVDDGEDELPDRTGAQQSAEPSRPQPIREDNSPEVDQSRHATRITIHPHDPRTGEEIEKTEVVKGYQCGRGQFVTFTAEELKALDVESFKVIDLKKFGPRDDIDPVYFDSPYYLYPDGPVAVREIGPINRSLRSRTFHTIL